jgi:hypothetical protein
MGAYLMMFASLAIGIPIPLANLIGRTGHLSRFTRSRPS